MQAASTHTRSLRVEGIASTARLEQAADAWEELPGGVPFCSRGWLGAWWQHYGEGRELYVLAVRDARRR